MKRRTEGVQLKERQEEEEGWGVVAGRGLKEAG